MSSFIKYLCIIGLAFLLKACAVPGNLTGGDRDVEPPKILMSSPQNGSTNFDGDRIEFEFDEYVNIASATKELVVSPPLEGTPEFIMKGKTVRVEWTDTLFENSTYMFQFGEGIVDNNEGNVLDSNIFVFSTGSYIDSLEISGVVKDAFTLKPSENVWVMLYTDNIDSLPKTALPRYFAKTNEQGAYRLKYLSEGAYKVFALEAENKGYLFDLPTEKIGFLDELVSSSDPADTLSEDTPEILIFKEADTTQFITETDQEGSFGLKFSFNKSVEAFEIEELAGVEMESWLTLWTEDRDTLQYWFGEEFAYDSLKFRIKADDFLDTIFLRKPRQKLDKANRATPTVKLNRLGSASHNHFDPLVLVSTFPLASADFSGSYFTENGDTISIVDQVSQSQFKITLDYPWQEGASYKWLLMDSTISDRFGRWNDSIIISFAVTKKTDFGELTINANFEEANHPYIWNLLGTDGKVLDEKVVKSKESINYKHLKTGNYRLRLIFDENGNGKWDPGFYDQGKQPEKIIYYENSVEIRSNWESELEWIMGQSEEDDN